MKSAIVIGSIVAVVAADFYGSAKKKSPPLDLRLEIVSEERCQFTPLVQVMRINARLTFVNSGRNELAVQEIGHPYLFYRGKGAEGHSEGSLRN